MQARRLEKIEAKLVDALRPQLEPGEEMATWVYGQTWPKFTRAILVGPIAFLIWGKPYFVVLTDRRVFVARSSMTSVRPNDVLWADPLGGVTVDRYKAGTMMSKLTFRRLADGSTLELRIGRPWREQARAVARALGASV
jgi:hypothetical protein